MTYADFNTQFLTNSEAYTEAAGYPPACHRQMTLEIKPEVSGSAWSDAAWRGEKKVHVLHCGTDLEPDTTQAAEVTAALDSKMSGNGTLLIVSVFEKRVTHSFPMFIHCPHSASVENLCLT